jgi:hypothetical protein
MIYLRLYRPNVHKTTLYWYLNLQNALTTRWFKRYWIAVKIFFIFLTCVSNLKVKLSDIWIDLFEYFNRTPFQSTPLDVMPDHIDKWVQQILINCLY